MSKKNANAVGIDLDKMQEEYEIKKWYMKKAKTNDDNTVVQVENNTGKKVKIIYASCECELQKDVERIIMTVLPNEEDGITRIKIDNVYNEDN